MTCSPPPASAAQQYTPAGICYACSISCHGDHNLVELFNRRNFTCDCGTKRFTNDAPCTLRSNAVTGARGAYGEEPAKTNTYNHNFQNKFCACGEEYDAEREKGTMYQCIGLNGGCGEDWYHPECLMGLPKDWYLQPEYKIETSAKAKGENGTTDDELPTPIGFPNEEDFESLICYKCTEANPWIKAYAGTEGFLPAVFHMPQTAQDTTDLTLTEPTPTDHKPSLKRKASDTNDDTEANRPASPSKRLKEDPPPTTTSATSAPPTQPSASTTTTDAPAPRHKHTLLPPASPHPLSLLLRDSFRDHLCHCPPCYTHLHPNPALLTEESTYEPSLSSSSPSQPQNQGSRHSTGSRSLLDRGEAALNNIDRVRAIEGVMVYNHLKDKVKEFLRPYAESGKVVGAEDIKKYFEGLRGDAEGIKEAGGKPGEEGGEGGGGNGGVEGDQRREQGGY